MSDHRLYLSVTTAAAASGIINLRVTTYDASPNKTITITVTGTTGDEDCLAREIELAATKAFKQNHMAYWGKPSFSSEPYRPYFRVTRTQHSVCFWCQASFDVKVCCNPTGAIISVDPSPALTTVPKAKSIGRTCGITFVDPNTLLSLTNQQISDNIQYASSEIVRMLNNNNIVISTYLNEFVGKDGKSVFTKPLPGLKVDTPYMRKPQRYSNVYTTYVTGFIVGTFWYTQLAYNWIRHTGELNFPGNQEYINVNEPYRRNNEVRVTHVAGHPQIPDEIARAVVLWSDLQANGASNAVSGGMTSLAGGSFKVTFEDFQKSIKKLFMPIKKYRTEGKP